MDKPRKSMGAIINMQMMGLGVASSFALQESNTARIFQTMGADLGKLPFLMLAGPVTGLLMQPIIGHYSDRTWGRLGRRRPYFLSGAICAMLAMFVMPNAGALWLAAVMLWILDFSLNATMEPGRAFTSELTPMSQRAFAFGMGMLISGGGQVVGNLAPSVLDYFRVANVAPLGHIPDTVRYSYYIGAICTILGVGWTVFSTREYSPAELAAFDDDGPAQVENPVVRPRHGLWWLIAGVAATALVWCFMADPISRYSLSVLTVGCALFGLAQMLNAATTKTTLLTHIFSDLVQMPLIMRRLALVHFFTWIALFIRWPYTTPVITQYVFHSTDTTSAAYNEGANWVGVLNGTYSLVSAFVAVLLIPALARHFGNVKTHIGCLCVAILSYLLVVVIRDRYTLFIPWVGFGIAWASLNMLPFVILTRALPANKLGIYLGIFNFFIVLPQILVATTIGPV
ncbi:MAG: MFS transporter, partial [Alphaproteobacteria bacterium]|nr:MFS transporter [Alphaproteobacteria bacterium]